MDYSKYFFKYNNQKLDNLFLYSIHIILEWKIIIISFHRDLSLRKEIFYLKIIPDNYFLTNLRPNIIISGASWSLKKIFFLSR
jgi:hypothetical protein